MKFEISEPVLVRKGASYYTRVTSRERPTLFLKTGRPNWIEMGGFVLRENSGKYCIQCIDTDQVFWFDEVDLESAL